MKGFTHIILSILFAFLGIQGCEKEASDKLLTDIDGNQYKIIHIGSMTWMAENLKVTRDRDGNLLDTYCYMDKAVKCDQFGRLYPLEEALKASPAGWRLPTTDDREKLEIELGMDPEDAGSSGWRGTDQGAQLKEGGSSGFEALLSGYKDGTVLYDGRYFDIYMGSYDKTAALSVRCVKVE